MYTIIQDTREKHGWVFEESDKCYGAVVSTLKTGDYTLKGYEDVLCIERKATAEELAINLGSKWKSFQKELERMKAFQYAYIICEFNISNMLKYPYNTRMYYRLKEQKQKNPNIKLPKLTGGFLLKRMNQISLVYPNIKIIYADNPDIAKKVVESIFYEVCTGVKIK